MNSFFNKFINIFFILGLFVVILGSFYRFYFVKEFIITIETPCDPLFEFCFSRNCETEECPSNNLSTYRVFDLNAYDFEKCEKLDGCESFCEINKSSCTETVCDSQTEICQGIQ